MDAGREPPELIRTTVRQAGEPVFAWRYWQLPVGAGELRSITFRRVAWPVGQAVRAFCGGGHEAPSEGCACGVYGTGDLETLRAHGVCLRDEPLVVGRVALWGRVVSDHDGFRGQYAYPSALSLVPETLRGERLEDVLRRLAAYGVAVATLPVEQAVGEISAALLAHQAMSR